jgi:tetratricopeptide (TPR) repeat protein
MPATRGAPGRADAVSSRRPAVPAPAAKLRIPLHERSQRRMEERWGFDLNNPAAMARAEEVLRTAPDDVDALLLAAAVRASRGDEAGALAAARSAVVAAPDSSRAHSTLAALLAGTGDTQTARHHAVLATQLDPEDPAAFYNLGLLRWSDGDRKAAHADLDRAASLLGRARRKWWRSRPA